MKTVVIFCRTIAADGYPFSDDYHWNAYLDLLLELKRQGAKAYFATDYATYLGDGRFAEAFTADAKVQVAQLERVQNVRADLVFEKGGFAATDVAVINPAFVHNITADKAETYQHFAKYQPFTVVCQTAADLKKAFDKVKTDMVVMKAAVSNGGREVLIGPKSKLQSTPWDAYPAVLQEFMDTSVGIANLVTGIHDVRVKIGGGQIFGGMVRTPAPGDYRANLAQGGSVRHLLPDEIPAEAVRLAMEIDGFFDRYPRYYAIDFANTANGWKLIELNSKPGLSPVSVSPAAELVIKRLAGYLIATASEIH